ncbi:HNH endonuclease [Paraburkholderia sediminicola]|uniref:HNH endonuclease n=1 Tax=Paraburkholderia sediminicola TaxID=458836 RepID=UPI0038BBEAE4
MQRRTFFSVNTDIKSYRKYHPEKRSHNPFEFWLENGCAYMTPTADNEKSYRDALSLVRPGDVLFAYESGSGCGYIAAGTALEAWDEVSHQGGHPELFRDPYEIYFKIRVDWNTDFSCSLAEIQAAGLRQYLATVTRVVNPKLVHLLSEKLEFSGAQPNRERIETAMALELLRDGSIPTTEREQLIVARVGQGAFRTAVQGVESCCRLTRTTDPIMLRASHIKPWRFASNAERLDGNNGLLLSPHVDHLFDGGWITFDSTGKLIVSPRMSIEILAAWNLPTSADTGPFNTKQAEYLAYHRSDVFKQ